MKRGKRLTYMCRRALIRMSSTSSASGVLPRVRMASNGGKSDEEEPSFAVSPPSTARHHLVHKRVRTPGTLSELVTVCFRQKKWRLVKSIKLKVKSVKFIFPTRGREGQVEPTHDVVPRWARWRRGEVRHHPRPTSTSHGNPLALLGNPSFAPVDSLVRDV